MRECAVPVNVLQTIARELSIVQVRELNLSIQMQIVKASGLFDDAFYLETYPDVASCGTSPLCHYLEHGYVEMRDPAPWFDTKFYVRENPDIGEMNPFIHYIFTGFKEGRRPNAGSVALSRRLVVVLLLDTKVIELGASILANVLSQTATPQIIAVFLDRIDKDELPTALAQYQDFGVSFLQYHSCYKDDSYLNEWEHDLVVILNPAYVYPSDWLERLCCEWFDAHGGIFCPGVVNPQDWPDGWPESGVPWVLYQNPGKNNGNTDEAK